MDVMYSPSSANPCAIKAVNPGPRPNPIIIAEKADTESHHARKKIERL